MSHPYPILLFMVLEAARRAETAAAALLTAVNTGTASTAELRRVLTATRSVAAAVGAAQTAAAEQIARRERHGDGGAEVLASSAGLSQQEARSQVATAAALQKVPELRDAVQSGDVPQTNARRLVDAITRTDSAAVAGDAELLAQAQSMRPEQFARTAQRWIGAHQADDGTAEHLRQRAKRYLRMHDTEDGMVRLHGEFDKITGTRIRNRLRHTASRLFDADKKLPQSDRRKFPQCMADALQHHTTQTNAGNESASKRITGSGDDNRSANATNNDNPMSSITNAPAALSLGELIAVNNDNPISNITGSGAIASPDSTGCGCDQPYPNTDGAISSRTGRSAGPPNTDSRDAGSGCAQHPHSTGPATRAGPGTDPANDGSSGSQTGADIHRAAIDTANNDTSMSSITSSGATQTGGCEASACRGDTDATVHDYGDADSTRATASSGTDAAASANSEDTTGTNATNADENTGSSGASGGWVADITVLAHVDDTTGELIGELSDGSKLPAAVLEELSCNARWSGLVFDRAGDAIWRSRSRRTVTDTQWQALLATYGGCFHCAAPAGMCQAHHITPYSQGGATSLDNLIMVCWNCHHKIHHHNWQITKHTDGSHTLHPPDHSATQPRYGPACADDYPPEPKPPPRRRRRRSPDRPETTTSRARTEANHARSQPEARRT